MILPVNWRNEAFPSVLADKHSIGTSPENGLHMYFSASFHFELSVRPDSGDCNSQQLDDLACNALRAVVKE